MPQFDAVGIVEALECKLLPYAQFDGVIPEPSDQQVGEYLTGLKKIIEADRARREARAKVDVTDPEQVRQALDDMTPQEFAAQAGEMAELYSALCSGTPSKEQILAVPRRARLVFYTWLQGEVLNPEAVTPAGNAQVRTLRQRATA